jgi:RimJ/RimL family protein N-acetyltransferase
MKTTKLICDRGTFVAAECGAARWLDWDADFEMAQQYWSRIPCALERKDWDEARDAGYRYCAIIQDKQIVALAAEYRFSDEAWMLAAVSTAEARRRRGYGKQVCSFVTAHILESVRLATCETRVDNVPMIRTAESIGFRRSEPSPPAYSEGRADASSGFAEA